jgi:transposase
MAVTGHCTAETSVVFLRHLRAKYSEALIVIWDNSPVHRGPEIREFLATPCLQLRMVALPAYSPDFNPDEAIWDWAREEVTANICFGSADKVQETLEPFFTNWSERTIEVQRRCRTKLQARADVLMRSISQMFAQPHHVDFTLVSV